MGVYWALLLHCCNTCPPAYTTVDTNCLSVGAAKDDGGGDDEQRCEIADDTERLGQIRNISISVP